MKNPFNENRRLLLLQGLEKSPGHKCNSGILQRLLQEYGHQVSAAETVRQLGWLEARGYVSLERLGDKAMVVASLTQAGRDVAHGSDWAEGVERALPE